MLTAAEKDLLTARWIGEAFRETAVLIWVFVPLDWIVGGRDERWAMTFATVVVGMAIFTVGVHFGFRGESDESRPVVNGDE